MAQSTERPRTRAPRKVKVGAVVRPSSLLTLEEAGPIQMGFWVPNRVWATAKFLVPLREGLRELGRDIDVQVDGGASSSGSRSPLDDGSRGAAKRGNVGAL